MVLFSQGKLIKMNCFTRMLGQIVRKDFRTMVLRLHGIHALKYYDTRVLLRPVIFVPLCKYTNTVDMELHQPTIIMKSWDDSDELSEMYHAHRFFETSSHYVNTVVDPNPPPLSISQKQEEEFFKIDWANATENQIVLGLRLLSYIKNTNDSGTIFSKILNVIQANCHMYENDTIINILKGLVYVRHKDFCTFENSDVRKIIDRELLKRFSTYSIPQILQIMYILHYFQYHDKHFSFPQVAIIKLCSKPQKLTPKHLVQLLFLISVCRRAPINMYELEYRLEQCKEELSNTEFGIASLGFFKTRTTIKSVELFNYIVENAAVHANKMESVTLSSIVKLIRYSLHVKSMLKVINLMSLLEPRIEDVNLMTVTHLAETYLCINLYKQRALQLIAQRFKRDIALARIKDMERICLYLSHFHYTEDTSVYDDLLAEITKRINMPETTDCEKFPLCLPRILASLSQLDIYPHFLLKHIMSDEYINNMCGGNLSKLDYCYYYLTFSIQIDAPSYDGPLLNRAGINIQSKKFDRFDKTMQMHRPKMQLSDIIFHCKEILKLEDAMYVGQYLPQYLPKDVAIGLDDKMNPIPIRPILSNLPITTLKRVSEHFPSNVRIIVLVVGSNQHKLRGTSTPPALLTTKVRQLERIGCIPRIVWYDVWSNISTTKQKRHYLEQLIFSDQISQNHMFSFS